MTSATDQDRMTRGDALLLLGACLLLFSVPVALNPLLSTHESVHCQNVREMLASGDWVVPRYGGRPWLERPPLPHWATAAVVVLTGQPSQEWSYRLSAVLAGTLTVLLVGWMASVWYGRRIGLLSGLALASMREFFHYALAPEADIFLCALVAAAVACFVRAEFVGGDEPQSFLGRRRWPVLLFFVLLGLTNMAKGLFFGTLMVAVPVGSFLLLQGRWSAWRRYLWLPGWLAFAAAALAWPVVVYLHYPDIIDLWRSDYLGRLNRGFMREPLWYYFAHLPWAIFPWSLPAVVGLVMIARKAWADRRGPERFLACWSLLTLLFLSIPQGKHHHYLLHSLGPWAVFSALGIVRLWEWLRGPAPAWLRLPWLVPAVAGAAGDAAFVLLHRRFAGQMPPLPLLLTGWPVYVALCWWAYSRLQGRVSVVVSLGLLLAGYWLASVYLRIYKDSYRADRVFAEEVRREVAGGPPLYVLNDNDPLDASWLLFYLPEHQGLLHNLSFLHDEKVPADLFLIGRAREQSNLSVYGRVEVRAQSRYARNGASGEKCWTLYRLRLHEELWRGPINVRISPMQATGRDRGPVVTPDLDRQAGAPSGSGG